MLLFCLTSDVEQTQIGKLKKSICCSYKRNLHHTVLKKKSCLDYIVHIGLISWHGYQSNRIIIPALTKDIVLRWLWYRYAPKMEPNITAVTGNQARIGKPTTGCLQTRKWTLVRSEVQANALESPFTKTTPFISTVDDTIQNSDQDNLLPGTFFLKRWPFCRRTIMFSLSRPRKGRTPPDGIVFGIQTDAVIAAL